MVKVSLVVPVYGVEKYIHQFLNSIQKQTLQEIEVILVDDGSKDNCPQILDEFARTDERYHVIHQPNAGVSSARNAGLARVTGKYVYVVDSDDWLEESALENLWNEAIKNNADIVYGDYICERSDCSIKVRYFENEFFTNDIETIKALQFAVNANGKRIKIKRPEFNVIDNFGGAPWRCLIKSSIIKDNNLLFDPYVRGLGDDILFTLHLYEYVKSVSYIPDVIYHYRKLDESYSHGYKENYLETVDRIFEKQTEFLVSNNKDDLAWSSYYMRVLIYLQQAMRRYFQNKKNPKSEHELYSELKDLLKSEPYKTAREMVPLEKLAGKKILLAFFLLKHDCIKIYWLINKIIQID